MSGLESLSHPLSEFAIVSSRSGEPSALHVPSGLLLHSRQDPVREARDLAQSLYHPGRRTCVIVGGGLGYLPEAVAELTGDSVAIITVEPSAALYSLARINRPDSAYFNSSRISALTTSTPGKLAALCRSIAADATVIVSPYLLRLSEHEEGPLSGLLRMMRSECASRTEYDLLLDAHLVANTATLSALPPVLSISLPGGKMVAVVGAGPSLNACQPFLRLHRRQFTIIAASGAVPSLCSAGIVPDWTVALEAKTAVLNDVTPLPESSKIIVFPSTHPDIMSERRYMLFSGVGERETTLETRGGSSAIPALDFALRASSAPIVLMGLDLSVRNGAYANGSFRTGIESPTSATLPKFLSMRSGLERLLTCPEHGSRAVYHVLDSGMGLKGAQRVAVARLPELLRAAMNQEV